MSVLNELRRRNVHRVALAYLAGAWLLIQIADTVFPRIGLSDAVVTGVIVLLAIGFIPALVLSWVFEWTPDGLRRERDIPEAAAHASTNRIDRLIMATLVIAVAYFGVDKFVIDPARDAAEIEAATEEAVKRSYIDAYRDRSIIVLPFLNMSNDVEQEYFADGVTEEILNVLAQIGEIRVISRSTAWTFKGDDIDIAALRDKLEIICDGGVRRGTRGFDKARRRFDSNNGAADRCENRHTRLVRSLHSGIRARGRVRDSGRNIGSDCCRSQGRARR